MYLLNKAVKLLKKGEPLRHVAMDVGDNSYILKTWDTERVDSLGRTKLYYLFGEEDDDSLDGVNCLFEGGDFTCSPLHAIDSDVCLRALLGFLTLQPGDTDKDYFDGYTDAQLDFAESSDCTELKEWAEDDGPAFDNCDDWDNVEGDGGVGDSDDDTQEDQDEENTDTDSFGDGEEEAGVDRVDDPDMWSKP